MSAIYDIHGLVKLALVSNDRAGDLSGCLAPLLNADDERADVVLTIGRRAADVPARDGALFRGRYKGLPWRLSCDAPSAVPRRIDFYAPMPAAAFLAQRMVIVPLIRQRLLARGGFGIPASAVRKDGEFDIYFGHAGTGKTRRALEAVEQGWRFVADNEIGLLPGAPPFGLFDEIELRYGTVYGTRFWARLPLQHRLNLIGYSIIAALTAGMLSLNLCLPPSQLGLHPDTSGAITSGRFVMLTGGRRHSPMELDAMVEAILAYERWYRSVFGSYLSIDPESELQQLAVNCRRTLQPYQFQRQ